MPDTPSIREDLTTLSTEALAKRLTTFATAAYASDQRLMFYVAEFGRRQAMTEIRMAASEAETRRLSAEVSRLWKLQAVEA